MKVLGVIPARFHSTRFPAKVLADVAGKSMIRRVYEQVMQARLLAGVVVATDHEEVAAEVQRFGGQVVFTRPDHPSGTDRCFEALQLTGGNFTHVINIQGDEPFIVPEQIDQLAATLQNPDTQIATLIMRAYKLKPQEGQLASALISIYRFTGRLPEALAFAESAVQQAPEHLQLLQTLAALYSELKRPKDSERIQAKIKALEKR
jgi:3-deoxy-D-manno-octulosonate cytidylyltransferase